jgi:hypothetical protein
MRVFPSNVPQAHEHLIQLIAFWEAEGFSPQR